MMRWKDKFQTHILERGFYYTYNVKNLKKDGNNVEATVSGSEDYMVKINLDTYEMSCTCPYFHRANCKHLAAVLFYLEEKKRDSFYVDVEIASDIRDVFNSVDDRDKLNFLIAQLEDDSELADKFRRQFTSEIDPDYYEDKLRDILYDDDEYGFKLSDFVENEMEDLYELGEYKLLVSLIKDATEYILEQMMFDDFYDGCNFYTFEDILKKLIKTPARSDIFNLISWQLTYYTNIYGITSLIDFYRENFTEDPELLYKIDICDELIEGDAYYKKEFVLIKSDALKRLNRSSDEIDEFRSRYSGYEEIAQEYIDEAIEDENYDHAISLLKKNIDKSVFWVSENYACQLKDLYFKLDDKDNAKIYLEKLLFDYQSYNMEYYKEYRNLFDDWESQREEVFEKITDDSFLNECFCEEKLYDRLAVNLFDERELSKYAGILKEEYSRELLSAYVKVVKNLASHSGTRKHYRNIAGILKDMKKIDGGAETVADILEEWQVVYKRRSAMLEELEFLKNQ